MARTKRTADVRIELQPILDELGDAIADTLSTHVDELLARARTYVMERLQAELAGAPAKPTKPAKAAKSSAGKACSLCREVGHNARRCPDAEPRAKIAAPPSAVVKPPPLDEQSRSLRGDRSAGVGAARVLVERREQLN